MIRNLLYTIFHPFQTYSLKKQEKLWKEAIEREELTNNIREAKFIVHQVNGEQRLVKNNLFARNGDVAYKVNYQ